MQFAFKLDTHVNVKKIEVCLIYRSILGKMFYFDHWILTPENKLVD